MSLEEYKDHSMLELFHMEAEAQTEVLNAGLMALEREPSDPASLEACMRAAHSLKGAARIVGLDAAVQLSHRMEDILVAAQQGDLHLNPERIDALLRGADMLLRLSGGEAADGLPGLLAHLEGTGAPTQTEVSPPGGEAPPAAAAGELPEPAEMAPEQRERVLRVSAERLDLLLDLAGRSLVAVQRAQPLGERLTRLRRQQQQVGQSLSGLREALLGHALPPAAQALLSSARNGLLEAEAQLQRLSTELDNFTWDFGQRSHRLYDAALASRMRPCADLMAGKARMVRDLGRQLGKQVRLELDGEGTQADRDVLERLEAPLIHLLRNAVDHGIEPPNERVALGKPAEGRVRLRARHFAGRLLLELEDDGRGVDLEQVRAAVCKRGLASAEMAERLGEDELLAFLFLPGFSMSEVLSEVSGRGVGLDAVQHELRSLRGSVRLRQRAGQGSLFQLELPLTLSVLRSLVVEVGGEAYALPLAKVERVLSVAPEAITLIEGQQHIWHEGRHIGLLAASQLLQVPGVPRDAPNLPVVLLPGLDTCHAVAVERVVGEQNLAVTPIDPRLGRVRGLAAGALLDDGAPVLILDVDELLHSAGKLLGGGQVERVARPEGQAALVRKRVLVVDDSLTVRELERKLLSSRGYEVSVAVDGMDGWNALRGSNFDLLVTDIDMPRMDGIELVTLLRSDPRLQSLPVIVVSYKDREEDRRRGLEAGADHYLTKSSFHDESLLDAVHMLVGDAHP
ncbi:hybrid sensor histidine kinase/response regulator [Acidovorax sp.]|uniref:hybrid sensor histidine kinase/response regulator n=1 Tax=Acidovorax sp. TaxID=1872122 RepID=UPI002608B9D8|nr:hybrid sensor histidine kinase/response regulator [Acidovorax sp.]